MIRRRSQRGFTLLELLIVVIVIGVLASFALPQFGRMTIRARAAEAQNLCSSICTAGMVFFQENGTFAAATLADLLVDIPPDNTSDFNYALTPAPTATLFSVTATGRAGANGIIVVGTIDNNGVRNFTATNNGVAIPGF